MDTRILLTSLKAAVALVAAYWGGLPALVQLLIGLMALDVATGFLAAYISRELSSDDSFRGMARKVMELALVAGAMLIEPHAGGMPLGAAVAGFYCAHELLSVIENAGRAGLPIPQVLRDALKKLTPEVPPA